jgi:hypothetical protein
MSVILGAQVLLGHPKVFPGQAGHKQSFPGHKQSFPRHKQPHHGRWLQYESFKCFSVSPLGVRRIEPTTELTEYTYRHHCVCRLSSAFRSSANARPPREGTCSLQREPLPTFASSISRRARRSTRDTLPWPTYTFHIPGNKVLHKIHFTYPATGSCAKRSVYLRSGTLKGHFRESARGLLIRCWRWSLARVRKALLTDETATGSSPRHRLTRRFLSGNAVVKATQVVTRRQGGRRACPGG